MEAECVEGIVAEPGRSWTVHREACPSLHTHLGIWRRMEHKTRREAVSRPMEMFRPPLGLRPCAGLTWVGKARWPGAGTQASGPRLSHGERPAARALAAPSTECLSVHVEVPFDRLSFFLLESRLLLFTGKRDQPSAWGRLRSLNKYCREQMLLRENVRMQNVDRDVPWRRLEAGPERC